MTKKITNKQKQTIHILKNKYKLSDTEYQDLMYDKFEEVSSIYLSKVQADEFIHLLNYNYNNDYKLGYITCLDKFVNMLDLEVLFKQKYNPSDLELQMFRMLDVDKQKELLKINE